MNINCSPADEERDSHDDVAAMPPRLAERLGESKSGAPIRHEGHLGILRPVARAHEQRGRQHHPAQPDEPDHGELPPAETDQSLGEGRRDDGADRARRRHGAEDH